MAYSIRNNSFVSHLTRREYTFTDRDSRRAAMEKMMREDAEVRETAQTRARDAGVKRPLSDREIREGSFMPDRRTTVERVADEVAARGAKHDPYAVAIETIRGKQRLTDPPEVRAADEEAIQRLEVKSAELQQQRAANPSPDPNSPADKATALREAAQLVANGFAGTPQERAQNKRRAEALLNQANTEDVKAAAEKERAEKQKANEPWVVDADATLFLIQKDPSIPQATVNEVRAMREKLVNLEATGNEWIALANSVSDTRAAIKAGKLAAKQAEIDRLKDEKTAIRNDEPPADPPEQPK